VTEYQTDPSGRRFWVDGSGERHLLCEGLTKRRTRCRADALPSSPFCLTHDPAGNGQSPRQNAIRSLLRGDR